LTIIANELKRLVAGSIVEGQVMIENILGGNVDG